MHRLTKALIPGALALLLSLTLGEAVATDGGLSVERIPSADIVIPFARAEVRDGEVRVYGTVSRRIPRRGAIPGHVHLSLKDASGRLLAEATGRLARSNRNARSAWFRTRMQVQAPSGAVLTIAYERD